MAVVTVQQIPDAKNITKIGKFMHDLATSLPPSCIEKTEQPCMGNADCTEPSCFPYANFDPKSGLCPKQGATCRTPTALPAGDWFCKYSADTPEVNHNDNCSVNTSCQLKCTTDQDCYAAFEPTVPAGKHQVYCNNVVQPAGCMFPPATDGCPPPDQLPPILKASVAAQITLANGTIKTGTTLDWFRCNATVGANQEPEALYEGGLRSAWLALDPNGPNCALDANGVPTSGCQNQELLRPDAWLAIVVVSDDDDCSEAFEKTDKLVNKEAQRSCQSHNDRLGACRSIPTRS